MYIPVCLTGRQHEMPIHFSSSSLLTKSTNWLRVGTQYCRLFCNAANQKKTYLLVNNLEEIEKLMKLLLNTIWQTTKSPNIETCTTVCSCDCPPATHSHHTSNVTCAQFFHLNNIKKSFNFLNHKQIRITNISAKTAAVVKCKIRGGGMLHSGLGPCQW